MQYINVKKLGWYSGAFMLFLQFMGSRFLSGFSVLSLYVFLMPMRALVSSDSPDMQIRSAVYSKVLIGVNMNGNGC